MRQTLGQFSALFLRGVLFPAGSCLRLRGLKENRQSRRPGAPGFQYVALRGTAAAARGFFRSERRRRYAAGRLPPSGGTLGPEKSVSQERCRVLPFSLFQGPRGGHGAL